MSVHFNCSSLLPHLSLQSQGLLRDTNQGKKSFWSAGSVEGTQGTSLRLRSNRWDSPCLSLLGGEFIIGISAHSHQFTLNFLVYFPLRFVCLWEIKNFDNESQVFRHRHGYRLTTWLQVGFFCMILFFIFIEILE